MSDDDSRGLESPDRSDVSTTARARTDGGSADDVIRDCLASIDYLTRTLLADVRDGEALDALETSDYESRREAVRHIREIRAEASQVALLLVGPEAVIPYRAADDPDRETSLIARQGSVTTSYLGPDPGAFHRERERQRECDGTDDRDE